MFIQIFVMFIAAVFELDQFKNLVCIFANLETVSLRGHLFFSNISLVSHRYL